MSNQIKKPTLFTFDIFGTVLDWETGLRAAAASRGYPVSGTTFDQVIDYQGKEESKPYQSYSRIMASSLIEVLRMKESEAHEVATTCGEWPLFRDSKQGMRGLMTLAPCIAISNSDLIHADQVQSNLGKMSDWISAEEVGAYKPSTKFWEFVSKKEEFRFPRVGGMYQHMPTMIWKSLVSWD